ncbi:hypothetical protein ACLOJK_015613 [Asimina triloba]
MRDGAGLSGRNAKQKNARKKSVDVLKKRLNIEKRGSGAGDRRFFLARQPTPTLRRCGLLLPHLQMLTSISVPMPPEADKGMDGDNIESFLQWCILQTSEDKKKAVLCASFSANISDVVPLGKCAPFSTGLGMVDPPSLKIEMPSDCKHDLDFTALSSWRFLGLVEAGPANAAQDGCDWADKPLTLVLE